MPVTISTQGTDLHGEGDAGKALNGSQVRFRFRTQEDDRVRPSHQALDGTVWEVGDPEAPVPPIDYGCRCMIEYVADEDSPAAKHLPSTDIDPVAVGRAYADYLDDNLRTWRSIQKAIAALPSSDRLSRATVLVRAADPSLSLADARDYARMITQAD